jgi:hypothetical protein
MPTIYGFGVARDVQEYISLLRQRHIARDRQLV